MFIYIFMYNNKNSDSLHIEKSWRTLWICLFPVRIPSDPTDGGRMDYRYEVLHSSGTSRRNLEVHCQKDHRRWESNLHRALDRSNVGCVLSTVAYLSHIERPRVNDISLADDVFFLWKSIRKTKKFSELLQLHLTGALPTVTREGAR